MVRPSADPFYVRYGDDGNPKTITPPSGYTLTGHFPATIGLNMDCTQLLTSEGAYTKGDGAS